MTLVLEAGSQFAGKGPPTWDLTGMRMTKSDAIMGLAL